MQGNDRMEEIMQQIKEHLLPTVDHGANGNVHHYNRAWEKIDKWFKKYTSQQPAKLGLADTVRREQVRVGEDAVLKNLEALGF